MKIIYKSRMSIKDMINVCKIDSVAWDWGNNESPLIYWSNILMSSCAWISRTYNAIYFAMTDDAKYIGYLQALLPSKPKKLHPLLVFLYFVTFLILIVSKEGRGHLEYRKLHHFQRRAVVKIGKQYLAGKNYNKIAEGLSVAVYPEYRKLGIYKQLIKRVMDDIGGGYFTFETSTESVYQAHIATGFKKIFEAPYFYPEKETIFVMYGNKETLNIKETEQ